MKLLSLQERLTKARREIKWNTARACRLKNKQCRIDIKKAKRFKTWFN